MNYEDNKIKSYIFVAGAFYYLNNIKTLIRKCNYKNQPVKLIREPENKYDCFAIRVIDKSENQIGYIPRVIVQYLAPLLDDNKINIFALINDIFIFNNSVSVSIKINIELLKRKKLFRLFEFNKKVTNERWSSLKEAININNDEETENIKYFKVALEKKDVNKINKAILSLNKIKNSSIFYRQAQTEKKIYLEIIEEKNRIKKQRERRRQLEKKRQQLEDEKLIEAGKNLIKECKYEGFKLLEKVSKSYHSYNLLNYLLGLKQEVNTKNYIYGKKLYEQKNWDQAIDRLKQIPTDSELHPNVQSIIKKAIEKSNEEKYNYGEKLCSFNIWSDAVHTLQKISNDSKFYNKAQNLIHKSLKKLDEKNYSTGNKLYKLGKWDQAIDRLEQISSDSELHHNAQGLIKKALEKSNEEKHKRYLQSHKGLNALKATLQGDNLTEDARENIKERIKKMEQGVRNPLPNLVVSSVDSTRHRNRSYY